MASTPSTRAARSGQAATRDAARSHASRSPGSRPRHRRARLAGDRWGRFPIKRSVGEQVTVSADVFADGHEKLAGVVKLRHVTAGRPAWQSALGRTRLRSAAQAASCESRPGSVAQPDPRATDPASVAWREVPSSLATTTAGKRRSPSSGSASTNARSRRGWTASASWLKALVAKADADQDVSSELLEGAELIQTAAVAAGRLRLTIRARPDRATTDENLRLLEIADLLRSNAPQVARVWAAKDPSLRVLMDARPDRSASTTLRAGRCGASSIPCSRGLGAWYEMFPRSVTTRSGAQRHVPRSGVAADRHRRDGLRRRLPAAGPSDRRDAPQRTQQRADGRGLAIRQPLGDRRRRAGGHTARSSPASARSTTSIASSRSRIVSGLEVALDIAFQASPDHPWVREHPGWFRHRPDGSIKLRGESAEEIPGHLSDRLRIGRVASRCGTALRDVFLFWIGHGVRIFRVDNPHTKPFRFWEWVIAEIRRDYPDAIFPGGGVHASEGDALSREVGLHAVVHLLHVAQLGARAARLPHRADARPSCRSTAAELLRQHARHPARVLQTGGRRGVRGAASFSPPRSPPATASTAASSCARTCRVRQGSEEYLDSESYQIKPRDWNRADSLRELIARVNAHPPRPPARCNRTPR